MGLCLLPIFIFVSDKLVKIDGIEIDGWVWSFKPHGQSLAEGG